MLGQEAKSLGLVDEIGDCSEVMKMKHPDFKLRDFSEASKFEKIAESLNELAMVQVKNTLLRTAMASYNKQ